MAKPDSKRPRIVHVVHSLTGGGTERTLVALLHELSSCGRHVVVTLREAGPLAASLPDHTACRPLAIKGRRWTGGLKLATLVRRLGADILHARNTGCWFDAIIARACLPQTKLVLGYHGLESAVPFDRRLKRLAHFGLIAGAHFACVSGHGRRKLMGEADVPASKIALLRNGVDLARFRADCRAQADALRAAWGFAKHDVVVGAVGSLVPVKRHDVLIDAAASVIPSTSSLRLVIIGEGPLRESLRRRIDGSNMTGHVVLAGARADILTALAAMDVFVCSSEAEELSNALLEALAAGLPVITSNVGDHASVVRHRTDGLVVPPASASALAGAIKELVGSARLRADLGRAAKARAQDYSFDTTVSDYGAFYRSLFAGDGARVKLKRSSSGAASAKPGRIPASA